ncbi:unnamed protein product, partial [Linum tenue]
PVSAGTSPTVPEQRLPLSKCTSGPVQEADQPEPSDIRKLVIPVPKTATPDGYNWRKYGQKQVKSPYGSRSYYRCTHSDCFVKKIECTDHCGHVIEIVNKGMHSHDPPRKSNSKRRQSLFLSAVFIRMKMDDLDCSGALTKTEKKPKFVVHAACDVGISGDGYRWRKYGQKMVKGNSHPRNYYRCTSAGCPVRKHIETAADNSSSVFITYKGIHDHDKPVPKKRQGPPSAPLITAAAAAASMNNAVQQQNKRTVPPLKPETSLTVGGDERKDKAVESTARALISIGFEIKPC